MKLFFRGRWCLYCNNESSDGRINSQHCNWYGHRFLQSSFGCHSFDLPFQLSGNDSSMVISGFRCLRKRDDFEAIWEGSRGFDDPCWSFYQSRGSAWTSQCYSWTTRNRRFYLRTSGYQGHLFRWLGSGCKFWLHSVKHFTKFYALLKHVSPKGDYFTPKDHFFAP